MTNKFDISGKVVVITGGAGLLGSMHAEAVAENGGIPILFDKNYSKALKKQKKFKKIMEFQAFLLEGMLLRKKI